MSRRKSYVLITVLFSIVVIPLLVFLDGGLRASANPKTLVPAVLWRAIPTDQAATEKETRFAMYLVKNDERAAEGMALKDLVLEENPILTEEGIASYRIAPDGRHFIRLKPGVKVRVAPPEGQVLLDRGFVVVADGNRIYLGDFHAPISSNLPKVAWVQLPLIRRGEAAELQIDIEIDACPIGNYPGLIFKDLRADSKILKVLQDIGKLDTKPDPEGWGEASQGVKVRLAADKLKWGRGDEPSFKLEILNARNSDIQIYVGPNAYRIIVDDRCFESAGDKKRGPLAPGGRNESIIILKPEIWRSNGEFLDLKPGKHQVRMICDLFVGYPPVGPFSNTVEIEILP